MTRSSAGLWKRSCTKCTTPVFFVYLFELESKLRFRPKSRLSHGLFMLRTNDRARDHCSMTRTWSYSRTFDHFIAHVWVLPWHVSLFVRYEVFCLTRCRRNRCMAKSWSFPTVPSIFFSPNKLVCRGIKRFVTPAELRFYSIVFLFVPCAWQVFSGLVLIFCNPNLCTNAFENVNTSRKLVAFESILGFACNQDYCIQLIEHLTLEIWLRQFSLFFVCKKCLALLSSTVWRMCC